MPKSLICVNCAKPFQAVRRDARFCTDECRYATWLRLQPKRYSKQDILDRLTAEWESRSAPLWTKQFITWIEENLT